jgi:hypothetical protein
LRRSRLSYYFHYNKNKINGLKNKIFLVSIVAIFISLLTKCFKKGRFCKFSYLTSLKNFLVSMVATFLLKKEFYFIFFLRISPDDYGMAKFLQNNSFIISEFILELLTVAN